jgi:predicted RNA polymerase sigma factor
VSLAILPGRILAYLAPRLSEAPGLSALMELQSSRLAARTAEDRTTPILLLDQDR